MSEIFPSQLMKDFPTETSQIQFLISCLSEIKCQLTSLLLIVQKQKTYLSNFFSTLTTHITNY